MIQSACSMIGPMLVDVIGAALAVSTLSSVKIIRHRVTSSDKLNVIKDMKQGIKAIKSNEALIRVSIPVLISTIVFVPLGTLLPLMVKHYFRGTAWHNGIVQTLFSS